MKIDSCVILCGGKSSRLRGANNASKIFLPFGDKPLIAHIFFKMQGIFKRVFIACKENQRDLIEKNLRDSLKSQDSRESNANLDCQSMIHLAMTMANPSTNLNDISNIFIIESAPIFAPQIHAPIVGIISAFTQLKDDKIFFISCDCPFISRHTIESLCAHSQSYDIVFAKDSRKIHPLVAVWSANLLPFLQDCLQKGDFKLQNIIDKAHTKSLHFGDSSEFLNINTISDYNAAIQMLG